MCVPLFPMGLHVGAAGIMLDAMSGDGKSGGPVRRPRAIEQPRVPPGPLADLKALVYQLYLEARTPTLNEIAAWIAADGDLAGAPGRDTISRIIGDAGLPASQADVVAVVTVLARAARWDPQDVAGRARDLWVAVRMAPARSPAAPAENHQHHAAAAADQPAATAEQPAAAQLDPVSGQPLTTQPAPVGPEPTPASGKSPAAAEPLAGQPPQLNPATTIDMKIQIALEGTVSEAAQRRIVESIRSQAAGFTSMLRDIEERQRESGAEQAEFTASTVIKANEAIKRQGSDSQPGMLVSTLAIMAPLSSAAAAISGAYLHSVWQAILFGITATVAVIATVLSVVLPRLRSK